MQSVRGIRWKTGRSAQNARSSIRGRTPARGRTAGSRGAQTEAGDVTRPRLPARTRSWLVAAHARQRGPPPGRRLPAPVSLPTPQSREGAPSPAPAQGPLSPKDQGSAMCHLSRAAQTSQKRTTAMPPYTPCQRPRTLPRRIPPHRAENSPTRERKRSSRRGGGFHCGSSSFSESQSIHHELVPIT